MCVYITGSSKVQGQANKVIYTFVYIISKKMKKKIHLTIPYISMDKIIDENKRSTFLFLAFEFPRYLYKTNNRHLYFMTTCKDQDKGYFAARNYYSFFCLIDCLFSYRDSSKNNAIDMLRRLKGTVFEGSLVTTLVLSVYCMITFKE